MPSDVPESADLDVVDGERVAGEQHLDVAEPHEVAEVVRAAGVDDHRPGHERDPPTARRARRIMSATRATTVSTRRSEETSLLMKPNVGLSRDCRSGCTRMPCIPHTTRSPFLMSRSFRQVSCPSSTTSAASMRCRSTTIHLPLSVTAVRWLVVE